MDKLKIDTQELRDAASALTIIRTEFENANENSDALASVVGEQRLAGRIREFAHNWDIKRKDFVEDILTLEQNLADGADALEKTDSDLAAGITGQAAPLRNVQ